MLKRNNVIGLLFIAAFIVWYNLMQGKHEDPLYFIKVNNTMLITCAILFSLVLDGLTGVYSKIFAGSFAVVYSYPFYSPGVRHELVPCIPMFFNLWAIAIFGLFIYLLVKKIA